MVITPVKFVIGLNSWGRPTLAVLPDLLSKRQTVDRNLYDFRWIQLQIMAQALRCITQQFKVCGDVIRFLSGQLKSKLHRSPWTDYPPATRENIIADCVV
jgi:hypothetical protein